MDTLEEIPLISYETMPNSLNTPFIQWSPDDQFILVTSDPFANGLNFRIYDAQTGDLLHERDEIGQNEHIGWYGSFR